MAPSYNTCMKHYVVLNLLLRFYLDRKMRLVKVHRAIRFNFSPYVASYIANNTEKRKQFQLENVSKAFYKLVNNAPYGKTIENVARRTYIRLLNDMEKARRLAEKPHCVDFRVFDGQVALPEEQVEAAAVENQQQQEALVGTEMRKLNHFINKPFANGFFLLKYSKLKMYIQCRKSNMLIEKSLNNKWTLKETSNKELINYHWKRFLKIIKL